jgi:large subunit ribosomal protein L18
VHRSGRHIYAQIIDDAAGRTLVSASSLKKGSKVIGANVDAAAVVGKELAEAAKAAGVTTVVFDRGGSCSMAASRRWPMPPVKAGWSSDNG